MSLRSEAIARLEHARSYLCAAQTIDVQDRSESSADAIVTLAVHAGVAASDAYCLLLLGRQSTSEIHSDAVSVLKLAGGNGRALGRLLAAKTLTAYNVAGVTRAKASKCVGWASALVADAERISGYPRKSA